MWFADRVVERSIHVAPWPASGATENRGECEEGEEYPGPWRIAVLRGLAAPLSRVWPFQRQTEQEVVCVTTAARVSVWAARGNGTVDLRWLSGPLCGEFTPPPHLATCMPRSTYRLGNRDERLAVYELVLSYGTADDITRWINLDELCRCLDELKLPPHVVGPWRGALRDAGLLPARSAGPARPPSADVVAA